MLPRVSRTFAINIRLLNGPLGEAVRIAYLLCRSADALEDSWPGAPAEIAARFDAFLAALNGDEAAAHTLAAGAPAAGRGEDLELLAGLPRLLRAFETLPETDRAHVREAVTVMARGMCRYSARAAERGAGAPYIYTVDELHDYCWVVAGCVGVMLTKLFDDRDHATPETRATRLPLAPVVGEALQLTNILLDWPTDVRRGRCHVPAEWLAEFRLAPGDLVQSGKPGVREIATRLEALAREALARVPDYLDTIAPRYVRYRLFCAWPSLWALASLENARRDPEFPWGPRRPRLPRAELWGAALRSFLRVRDPRALRRLYAAGA